jgi:hypothetical protein
MEVKRFAIDSVILKGGDVSNVRITSIISIIENMFCETRGD